MCSLIMRRTLWDTTFTVKTSSILMELWPAQHSKRQWLPEQPSFLARAPGAYFPDASHAQTKPLLDSSRLTTRSVHEFRPFSFARLKAEFLRALLFLSPGASRRDAFASQNLLKTCFFLGMCFDSDLLGQTNSGSGSRRDASAPPNIIKKCSFLGLCFRFRFKGGLSDRTPPPPTPRAHGLLLCLSFFLLFCCAPRFGRQLLCSSEK